MKKIVLSSAPGCAQDCPFSSDGDCMIYYATVGADTYECNDCLCRSKQGFDFCECPFCVSLEDILTARERKSDLLDLYVSPFNAF